MALFLLGRSGNCIFLEGEQIVNTRGNYLALVMLVCSGLFPIKDVVASVQENRCFLRAHEQVSHDTSDLRRDEERLETDMGSLRNSLRNYASQEWIDRLRSQVRRDWNQIVLDRSHFNPSQEDRTVNLAKRRIGQRVQRNRGS